MSQQAEGGLSQPPSPAFFLLPSLSLLPPFLPLLSPFPQSPNNKDKRKERRRQEKKERGEKKKKKKKKKRAEKTRTGEEELSERKIFD
jgi:hypothetical protein